jgi:hypothetical protein
VLPAVAQVPVAAQRSARMPEPLVAARVPELPVAAQRSARALVPEQALAPQLSSERPCGLSASLFWPTSLLRSSSPLRASSCAPGRPFSPSFLSWSSTSTSSLSLP